MIKVWEISYSYGFGQVFSKASFSVGKGMTVGLVGPNGAGKSTLFSLLRKEDAPYEGKIEVTGTIGHVPQEIKHDPVMDAATSIRKYIDPDNKKDDFELKTMLSGLEIHELSLDKKPQQLSGGQKTKLALLRALIAEPDVLLLDEPTNFLDTDGKAWLMTFLRNYTKTLVIISHDLLLLDAAITKVIAINPFTKKIEEYKGNYTSFVRLKKEADELLKRKIINEQKHIKRMERGLLRMQRFTSEKGVRQRTNLKNRIEKLKANLPELPPEIRKIRLVLPEPPATGEIPIAARNIVKLYNHELILSDVSFSLLRNERMAFIGPNGAGKSTLIKILMGMVQPDAGEVEQDDRLSIGYYSQEFETFNFEQTILELVQDKSAMHEEKVRPFLYRFNFHPTRLTQKIGTLSGGEKTRLSIALLMLGSHNLLILDEPTTYLDPLSQRIILDALKAYTGAMIFVSHTEEFVQELSPRRVLLLPENKTEFWIPELIEKVGVE